LWKAAVSGVFFLFAKKSIIKLTYYINLPHMKDQDDPELLKKRTHKAGKYIFATIYFTFATTYGYLTFKDAPFLPWYLGGSGTWDAMFIDWPYMPFYEGAVTYAMLQIGYHFGDLLNLLFFEEKQSDFEEMLCHHIAASTLLISMIYSNSYGIGCVVSFLHDIADITASVTKYFACTPYTTTLVSWFISNMVVWAYTRLIVLPYLLYRIWTECVFLYKDEFVDFWPATMSSAIMLTMMQILHIYWYFLFVKMLCTYKKKGVAEDIQNKVEKKKKN
jgi:hypothetical protein